MPHTGISFQGRHRIYLPPPKKILPIEVGSLVPTLQRGNAYRLRAVLILLTCNHSHSMYTFPHGSVGTMCEVGSSPV